MSLISTRSFIAPLLDKRNLITILLVAIFFGVFRWAGGGVSTSSIDKSKAKVEKQKVEQIDASALFGTNEFSSLDPREEVKNLSLSGTTPKASAKARPKEGLSEEDVLKLIAPKKKEAPRKKEFEAGESLDDIERSLGLR